MYAKERTIGNLHRRPMAYKVVGILILVDVGVGNQYGGQAYRREFSHGGGTTPADREIRRTKGSGHSRGMHTIEVGVELVTHLDLIGQLAPCVPQRLFVSFTPTDVDDLATIEQIGKQRHDRLVQATCSTAPSVD
jgi:hypothetical protein